METEIALTEQIKKLCIELNVGELFIAGSDTGAFSYEIENAKDEDFEILKTDTELSIKDKTNLGGVFNRWFNNGRPKNENPKITISIPHNHRFEKVKIKGSVAKSNIKDVSADSFKLSAGVGEVKLKNITTDNLRITGDVGRISGKNIFAKKAKVNAGVGPCDFANSEFSETTLNCGIGRFRFEGKMTGENNISAGVGAVELKLNSSLSEFNLYVKTGIGRIKINDEKLDGLGAEKKYTSDSSNTLKIGGGIGNLDIKFQE